MLMLVDVLAHSGAQHGELWINPEHIVTARQLRRGSEPDITLDVELKLVGSSIFRARLGTALTAAAADDAWAAFIARCDRPSQP